VIAGFRNREYVAGYILRSVNPLDVSISVAKRNISQLCEKHPSRIVRTHCGEHHQRQIENSHNVFEDPVPIPEQSCPVKAYPDASFTVRHQLAHRSDGTLIGNRLLQKLKRLAVEPNQASFCSDPEIAVARLCDCIDFAADKSPFGSPPIVHILQERL
jgi:hypothetical protein